MMNDAQKAFIEAYRLGYTLPEIFHIMGINNGTLSAWRRWHPDFTKAMTEVKKEGLANRKTVTHIGSLYAKYGRHFRPSKHVYELMDARARAGIRGRG